MRPVRLRNLRERRASALSDVSDHYLGAERLHNERSGDEPNDGNATDEAVAVKRAQTELTASVGSRLVPQTTGWKRLLGGRRKAPTAGAWIAGSKGREAEAFDRRGADRPRRPGDSSTSAERSSGRARSMSTFPGEVPGVRRLKAASDTSPAVALKTTSPCSPASAKERSRTAGWLCCQSAKGAKPLAPGARPTGATGIPANELMARLPNPQATTG